MLRFREGATQDKYAFDGALRFLGPSDGDWLSLWERGAQASFPNIELIAIDAFGSLYGLSDQGEVSIIWTETGDVEDLGITERDFYAMVRADPNATINHSLYLDAVRKYGRPNDDQIFALKVETALGGGMSIDNVFLSGLGEQMFALGKIARQIGSDAIGTVYGAD